MISLKIGSIEIPNRAALDLDQTYEPIGGETILRTMSGAGIKQVTWAKLRTTISGNGWSPPGLESLDTTTQQDVSCLIPRALIANAGRQATLPAARRSDEGAEPWAWAILPDGSPVNTPVDLAGDVATAIEVPGAIGYQILYYPRLTCWVSRPTESGVRSDATYRWEITAEEV
jgi:hypothetical protein